MRARPSAEHCAGRKGVTQSGHRGPREIKGINPACCLKAQRGPVVLVSDAG